MSQPTRSRPDFPRFSELTPELVNRDLQVHTSWTDGEASVGEVLERARAMGLAELAFTEHARATSDYYPAFFDEIDGSVDAAGPPTVYRGFEVKVLDASGALDITTAMRDAADLVLASVHSFPRDGKRRHARELSPRAAFETEFELASSILLDAQADVLAHAGGMSLRAHEAFPTEYLAELMRLAGQTGVAFEINASYHDSIFDTLLELLEEQNPRVSIGSDVHRLDEIGRCRDLLRSRFAW